MAGRVDLDAVERHARIYDDCDDCKTREMAAELRVAREVIGQLPRTPCPFCGYGGCNHGCPLAAYDQHVQSAEVAR
jgi:hypothetical protein